jgi:hypothetical protein
MSAMPRTARAAPGGWPRKDGELSDYFRWLAHTHAMRWHVAHNTVGRGHLYQGRFKSFPVEKDDYFYTLCRYVERNALTAQVVERAEDWRWGSLWARRHGDEKLRAILSDWPLDRPRDLSRLVNEPMTRKRRKQSGRALRGTDRSVARTGSMPGKATGLVAHTAWRRSPEGHGGRAMKTSCVPVSTSDFPRGKKKEHCL